MDSDGNTLPVWTVDSPGKDNGIYNTKISCYQFILNRNFIRQGLKLELFLGPPHIDASKKLYYYDKLRGLRIVINNQSILRLASESIGAETGVCTNIQLVKSQVTVGNIQLNILNSDELYESKNFQLASTRSIRFVYRHGHIHIGLVYSHAGCQHHV